MKEKIIAKVRERKDNGQLLAYVPKDKDISKDDLIEIKKLHQIDPIKNTVKNFMEDLHGFSMDETEKILRIVKLRKKAQNKSDSEDFSLTLGD